MSRESLVCSARPVPHLPFGVLLVCSPAWLFASFAIGAIAVCAFIFYALAQLYRGESLWGPCRSSRCCCCCRHDDATYERITTF